MHAKSLLFLGHTDETRRYLPSGMGEIANSMKLKALMEDAGYKDIKIFDIFELFGPPGGLFRELALLNYELANSGSGMLDEVGQERILTIRQKIESENPQMIFLMSNQWSLGAIMTTGIQQRFPFASKLYVHHSEEALLPQLYEPAHLLVTESPLANKVAMESGIDPWKILYLPQNFPKEIRTQKRDRKAILELAKKLGKKIELNERTVILGTVSRLALGKNVEYALSSAKDLHESGAPILFVLKGVPTANNDYEIWLQQQLQAHENEPWFLWDKESSPLSDLIKLYGSFDIALQLSGAEAGSNTIVELLALGIPTLIVEASTNPSLFSNAALFVKKDPQLIEMPLPFYRPDHEDLTSKLKVLVANQELRLGISMQAKRIAEERFSPEVTSERIPLLVDATKSFFKGGKDAQEWKSRLLSISEKDMKQYGL